MVDVARFKSWQDIVGGGIMLASPRIPSGIHFDLADLLAGGMLAGGIPADPMCDQHFQYRCFMCGKLVSGT